MPRPADKRFNQRFLRELKLPTFIRHYQYYQHYQYHQEQAIENGYGHIRYLSGLCEQEAADRYQKRVLKWTEAGLPAGKSFATLALAELSAAVQQQVIALKDQTAWALRPATYCW